MLIYELTGDSDLAWVNTTMDGDASRLDRAVNKGETYEGVVPVPLEYSTPEGKSEWLAVDCVRFPAYGTPLFSQEAISKLRDYLEPNGYLLKTELASWKSYDLFICSKEESVLDREKADIEFFRDGGIMKVRRYELLKVPASPIFRIKGKRSTLFVTDDFAEAVGRSRLSGFVLSAVWSSSSGGIPITRSSGPLSAHEKRLNLHRTDGVPFARA